MSFMIIGCLKLNFSLFQKPIVINDNKLFKDI